VLLSLPPVTKIVLPSGLRPSAAGIVAGVSRCAEVTLGPAHRAAGCVVGDRGVVGFRADSPAVTGYDDRPAVCRHGQRSARVVEIARAVVAADPPRGAGNTVVRDGGEVDAGLGALLPPVTYTVCPTADGTMAVPKSLLFARPL